jgi:rare lipoprotein A
MRNNVYSHVKVYGLLLSVIGLHACSSSTIPKDRDSGPPLGSVDVSQVQNAIPKDEDKSKYGNPESYVVFGKRYYVMDGSKGFVERGIASWYGEKFHGRRTSSGETYDMYAMTAAHKNLPLPTYVEIKNINNGKKIIVKVNDRGPFHDNRIIDLSYSAAVKLDILKSGTGLVEVKAIDTRTYNSSSNKKEATKQKILAPVYTKQDTSQLPDSFYIQVGSFSDPANAEKLRAKLSQLDEKPVSIREARVNDLKLYRVRIGPIYDIDTADKIVAKLSGFGVTEHQVVVD